MITEDSRSEDGSRLSSLGPGNPRELGEEVCPLYLCEGTVHAVGEFASTNLDVLSPHEQETLRPFLARFPGLETLPPPVRDCLTRSEELGLTNGPTLVARRSGARSAYWHDGGMKFKGCRPVTEGATYPVERLPLYKTRIEYSQIPFGVLSRDNVMREILAYCFFQSHGLPTNSRPVCVYRYSVEGHEDSYCLVSISRGETRLDRFVEYPDMTVAELIDAKRRRDCALTPELGGEIGLSGLNLWWYVEEKSKLMSAMHFAGGFRGILNSNIGNDVLLIEDAANPTLCICDFDTFTMIDIPGSPSSEFLRSFVLKCVVEIIKGSLPILDYVELPSGCDLVRRSSTLARIYFGRSSLWRAYQRRFELCARRRGWDPGELREARDAAVRTGAFADVISQALLNSHYLETSAKGRRVFYPSA